MTAILIILGSVILIIIIIFIIFIVRMNRRTNELRKAPKVGDNIRYFIGEIRHYGTVYKVFSGHVRVKKIKGYDNVRFNNIYCIVI